MNKSHYELSVCVNGRPIREFGHRGLTFVEGRKNQPYTLKFRNNSAQRVLAVVSVDGLGVVDGKPADAKSKGYIVPAYQSCEIRGWRPSLEKTNKFVFNPKYRAVSTQQEGEDTNCGVIAVKVFSEAFTEASFNNFLRTVTEEHHHHHHYPAPVYHPQPRPFWWYDQTTCRSTCAIPAPGGEVTYGASVGASGMGNEGRLMSSSLCPPADDPLSSPVVSLGATLGAQQENPSFNLGTGWGEAQDDKVEEANFDRGIELAELTIYYSDAQGLKDAGIEVDKKPAITRSVLPRGFNGFCKPPVITSS